jgi:hypothetical protein
MVLDYAGCSGDFSGVLVIDRIPAVGAPGAMALISSLDSGDTDGVFPFLK